MTELITMKGKNTDKPFAIQTNDQRRQLRSNLDKCLIADLQSNKNSRSPQKRVHNYAFGKAQIILIYQPHDSHTTSKAFARFVIHIKTNNSGSI